MCIYIYIYSRSTVRTRRAFRDPRVGAVVLEHLDIIQSVTSSHRYRVPLMLHAANVQQCCLLNHHIDNNLHACKSYWQCPTCLYSLLFEVPVAAVVEDPAMKPYYSEIRKQQKKPAINSYYNY